MLTLGQYGVLWVAMHALAVALAFLSYQQATSFPKKARARLLLLSLVVGPLVLAHGVLTLLYQATVQLFREAFGSETED